MSISTVCGDCRKKYTVKDEMAGKRFRCKDCEAIVTVPDAVIEDDDDDPFGGEELQSTGRPIRQYEDDDDDDEVETKGRERIRREPKPKKVVKKKKSGPSIPVSAVIAITLQILLALFLALGCLGSLVQVAGENEAAAARKIGSLMGIVTRFIIALVVLLGLLQRKYSARQWSRGLCVFGDIVGGLIIFAMVLIAPKTPDTIGTIIVMVGQCAIWTTIIICLSTESADDWFTE